MTQTSVNIIGIERDNPIRLNRLCENEAVKMSKRAILVDSRMIKNSKNTATVPNPKIQCFAPKNVYTIGNIKAHRMRAEAIMR